MTRVTHVGTYSITQETFISNRRHYSLPTISRPTKVRVCVFKSSDFNSPSVSFVVNLGQLDSHKDVLADDMGMWKHNGINTVLVSVTFTEEHIQIVRRLNSSILPGGQIYSVMHVYRTHATDSTLKKVTKKLQHTYMVCVNVVCHCTYVYKYTNYL